ncbi:MAG TPA: LamG domain-containing protein, partial [Streptosporangiaceae bacterium]|nr:LamG domain-containing protein [Streptosporangiaceae bacterium]
AGGQFGNARPPGQPAGSTTGEVTRTFLAAFNSTTGALITSFDPTITETGTASRPGVYALALSPDGKTLYAGGTFNKVDGQSRSNLAAFDTSTGALTSWAPTSNSKVDAIAVSPSGSQIYVGGDLAHLDGGARTFAGAVDASGKLLPWAPALNSAVYTLAVTPDDSQVLIGGFFQTINGVSQNAAGAVDPTTGTTNVPWTANIVPYLPGTCTSAVKDIVISGGTAYISAEGNGGGCFDGDFAVSLGSTDSLLWQNVCLGATQALAVVNGWLFKGSHAHNCTFEAGGFPPVTKAPGEWVTWHLLDQSLTDGTIGHWTPSTNVGATEQGVGNLGPHAMATDGSQLFVGGDFTVVDNHAQQGFAIFPAGVDPSAPQSPSAAPTVTSTSAGVDSVSFPAVSSRDVGTLSYALYRDGTKIATLTATSWPWALPVLRYRDAGLAPGSRHTYTYTVNDGHHTTGRSSASAPVTVSATSPSLTYPSAVLHDSPSFYWRLGESSGTTAADRSGHGRSGIYEPGTTLGASGAITGGTNTAVSLDGKSDGYITSAKIMNNPQTFSMELWFKTTTDHGGRLIGFGNARTGTSSEYDRQIYMMNDGQLVFGVYHNGIQVIETTHVYNDGQWHYAVATLGSSGMRLYIDGSLAGTNTTSSAEAYNGYWRVGGDNLKGRWSLTPVLYDSQGATSPNSYYFAGTVDEVAVYAQALSAARVAAHYAANALSH